METDLSHLVVRCARIETGPLIHLPWIGHLNLLPDVFEEGLAPVAVQDEALRAGASVPGLLALREAFAVNWLKVRPVTDPGAVATVQTDLDRGESEAIVLMREARTTARRYRGR